METRNERTGPPSLAFLYHSNSLYTGDFDNKAVVLTSFPCPHSPLVLIVVLVGITEPFKKGQKEKHHIPTKALLMGIEYVKI